MGSVKDTIHDLLRNVGYFSVWEGQGTEVGRYIIDDIEYVQVKFDNSSDVTYTYLVGEDNG